MGIYDGLVKTQFFTQPVIRGILKQIKSLLINIRPDSLYINKPILLVPL